MTEKTEKVLVTIQEAADMLSCSKWQIFRLIERGYIKKSNLQKRNLLLNRKAILELAENSTKDVKELVKEKRGAKNVKES